MATTLGTTLLIAGCGGGGKPRALTSAGRGGPANGAEGAYKFSACMREHGVPNFPDPVVHSSAGSQSVSIGINPSITSSPAYNSAQTACQHFMPQPSPSQVAAQQHTHEEHMLAFARCMRSKGVTDFPDPNSQGDIKPPMLAQAGIDIHAPAFAQKAIACAPTTDGDLTAAEIRQGLAAQ